MAGAGDGLRAARSIEARSGASSRATRESRQRLVVEGERVLRARVVSGDATSGYTVEVLEADGSDSGEQYTVVFARPAASFAADAEVELVVPAPGVLPFIRAGGGSGGDVPVIVGYIRFFTAGG